MKFLLFIFVVFLLLSCSMIETVEARKKPKSGKSKQKSTKKSKISKKLKQSTGDRISKKSKKRSKEKLNFFDESVETYDIVGVPLLNVNSTNNQLNANQERYIGEMHRQLVADGFRPEVMQDSVKIVPMPTGHTKLDEVVAIAFLLLKHHRYDDSDVVFSMLNRVRNDIKSVLFGHSESFRYRSNLVTAAEIAHTLVAMHEGCAAGYHLLARISEDENIDGTAMLNLYNAAYERLDSVDRDMRCEIVIHRGQRLALLNYKELALENFAEYFRWAILGAKGSGLQMVASFITVGFYKLYVSTLMAVGDVDKTLELIDQVLELEADRSMYLTEQQKRDGDIDGFSLTQFLTMMKISTLVTVAGRWQEAIETVEGFRSALLDDLNEGLLERAFTGVTPDRDYTTVGSHNAPDLVSLGYSVDDVRGKKYVVFMDLLRHYGDVELQIGRLDSALLQYSKVFGFIAGHLGAGFKLGVNPGEFQASKEQIYRVSMSIVSCLAGLGRYREAAHVLEEIILDTLPRDKAGYTRDVVVALWTHLDTPFTRFNGDLIVDKETKSGFVRQVAYEAPGESEFDKYFNADNNHLSRPDSVKDCSNFRLNVDDLAVEVKKWETANSGRALSQRAVLDIRRVKLIELVSSTIGGWIQLQVTGFYPSTRSFRGFGLAVLHMAQKLRIHAKLAKKHRVAFDDANCGGISSDECDTVEDAYPRGLYVADAGSSRGNYSSRVWFSDTGHDHRFVDEAAKTHLMEYRDWADVAVRYRQYVDSATPIYWVDNMPADALLEFNPMCGGGSYSLATLMVTGELKSARYYSNYELAFNISRFEMLSSGFYTVGQNGNVLETATAAEISGGVASSLHDLYLLAGERNHWVMTTCTSLIPGLHLEGSRLAVTRLPAASGALTGSKPLYKYDLKTPTTWKRVHAYEQQMQQSFEILVELLGDAADPEAVLHSALEVFYFWANFASLTRGTAFVGYSMLASAMLARGYRISSRIPPGRQLDWEAILYRNADTFVSKQLDWIVLKPLSESTGTSNDATLDDSVTWNEDYLSQLLDNAEYSLDKLFGTPRELIAALHGGVSVVEDGIVNALGLQSGRGAGLSEELYPDSYEL